jgi:hypothetical protein
LKDYSNFAAEPFLFTRHGWISEGEKPAFSGKKEGWHSCKVYRQASRNLSCNTAMQDSAEPLSLSLAAPFDEEPQDR